METAERVDEIRELVAGQTESLREMQKETDEFTHRENVKVYRNVQAVVVEEVKKQTEELKEANRGAEAHADHNAGCHPGKCGPVYFTNSGNTWCVGKFLHEHRQEGARRIQWESKSGSPAICCTRFRRLW